MRVYLAELPTDGLSLPLGMDCTWAVSAISAALEGPVRELEGSLSVRPVGRGIAVLGGAWVVVEGSCDRCLSSLLLRLGGEVDLWFDDAQLDGDVNVGLHEDELDVGFLEDGKLELGEAVAEFFVLEAPARLRCEDPGVSRIQPGCCELASSDQDEQRPVDPRFAALKNFQAD